MVEKKDALSGAERAARFSRGKKQIHCWVPEESANEYREIAFKQGYSSVAEKLRDHINTEREQWKNKRNSPSETKEGIPLTVSENQPES